MNDYITLRDRPELADRAAAWFHEKWHVPKKPAAAGESPDGC